MRDICVIWFHMLREAYSRALELAAEDHASSQKKVYSSQPRNLPVAWRPPESEVADRYLQLGGDLVVTADCTEI